MRSTVQSSPAFRLDIDIQPTPYGHHVRLLSFVPVARSPEVQVRFAGLFSLAELTALRQAIDAAIDHHGDRLFAG